MKETLVTITQLGTYQRIVVEASPQDVLATMPHKKRWQEMGVDRWKVSVPGYVTDCVTIEPL